MNYEATSFECSRIAQDLQIRKLQVESVVQLFNEGNSIPFIARYRKEKTGGLDEDALRLIQTRLNFLKQLGDRKQTILKSIEQHGKLTPELKREIQNAPTVRRLDDLYLPFKPRKKALANAARDKGLEPLALAIWHSDPAVGNLDELLAGLVNPEKQLNSADDVKLGVQHLIAEMINETAEVRAVIRRTLWKTGSVAATKNEKVPEGQGNEYKPYFQFKEALQEIRPHRILALNRGERDGVLMVKLEWPMDQVQLLARKALAEHLLKIAGTPPPQPSQPSRAPAPPPPTTPDPVAPPESPPPDMPPSPAPEAPPAPPSEAPPVETPPPMEPGPAEVPPIAPPAPGTPSAPHAAPLVESLTTHTPPELTGDPLVEGEAFRSPHAAFLNACLEDALNRLLLPNLEREVRGELTDEAELHGARVLAHNLRSLLMQPPLPGKRVLAIDPGFRNGCKLAVLDEAGSLLEHDIVYPHGGPFTPKKKEKKPQAEKAEAPPAAPVADAAAQPATEVTAPPAEANETLPAVTEVPAVSQETPPAETPAVPAEAPAQPSAEAVPPTEAPPAAETPPPAPEPTIDRRAEAKTKIEDLIKKHNVNVIALGNGAGCRETEEVIAEVIAGTPDLTYVIVNEAGAGAYATTPFAKEEFANVDAATRGAISLGRRLQDPLAELVKIDAQSLAAGLTAHDTGRKELKETLEGVVESCVNQIGVDINNANVPVLRHVSGLNSMVAREIVEHRKNHGPFASREQLQTLPGMNPARYAQAAGFVKVTNSSNSLDRTWLHPESYPLAEKVFAELGFQPNVLDDPEAHKEFRRKLNEVNLDELAKKLEMSVPALDAMFLALARPGKDPRDDMPPPIFKKSILKLEDLQPGQELKGTVLNVVDFGAFVDVGMKDSGLVHISQMANKYIKSPYDVVSVNDIVKVWVLKIDKESNHVSLTMIQPGSERKPGEKPARPQRREDAPVQREDRGQRTPPPQRERRGPGGPPREGQRQGARPPQRDRRGPAPREAARDVTPVPPPEQRKPKRDVPMPKLSEAAKEGKTPLRTLGELAAFFKAKEEKDNPPPAAPTPVVEEKKETPSEAAPEQKPSEGSITEPPAS